MFDTPFSKVDPRTGRLALDDPFGLDSLNLDGKSKDQQLELLREHVAYQTRIGPNHLGLDLSKSDVKPIDDGQLQQLRGLIVQEACIARERQMRRELAAHADAPPPSFVVKLLPDEIRIARDRAMQQLIDAQTLIARGRQMERQPDALTERAKVGGKVHRPTAPKPYDKARVEQLITLGYVPITQRQMHKEFKTSTGGSNEAVGKRAQQDGSIKHFECHGGKLWILHLEKTTPGTSDRKPVP
jgi:hypothetical protein